MTNIFKVFLNDARTDANKGDRYGNTPLMFACLKFASEEVGVKLISLLLKHSRIEINKKDKFGGTAIHSACAYCRSKCVARW